MTPGSRLKTALAGKRLLVFDFDGTIADTSPLHALSFREVLEPRGIQVDYDRIAGLRTQEAMEKLFALAGRPRPDDPTILALVADKQSRVRQLIAERLSPLPGVEEFLAWARERFRLALVTSGSRGTVSLGVATLGLAGWFDPVICSEDVKRAKPDPEGFLKALRLAGVAREEALVFEDSSAGFEAAVAADIDYLDVNQLGWVVHEAARK